jgi:hypothetical protein
MSEQLEIEPAHELATRQPQEVAPVNIGEMMRDAVRGGQPIKELAEVFIKMQDRDAERQFNTAFVELQREIPKVKAVKSVPNNDGTPRYSFAPFEEIDDQARPVCLRHGFTYTFGEGQDTPGKVVKLCTLAHVGGHSRTNSYSVRIGKGPPGCTESQQDGAAHSYAKRGALCDCLNIRVDKALDHNPRDEGKPVTADQAAELERRVHEINGDIERFLKFAGADMSARNRFATIPANRYAECDAMLRRKEGGK